MSQYPVFLVLLLPCVLSQQSSIFPINITQSVVRAQNAGSCPRQQMLDSQIRSTFNEIHRIVGDSIAPIVNCPYMWWGGPR